MVAVQSQQVLTPARDSTWLNYEERRHGNEVEDANRIEPHSSHMLSFLCIGMRFHKPTKTLKIDSSKYHSTINGALL
jgi:hypothetical protein